MQLFFETKRSRYRKPWKAGKEPIFATYDDDAFRELPMSFGDAANDHWDADSHQCIILGWVAERLAVSVKQLDPEDLGSNPWLVCPEEGFIHSINISVVGYENSYATLAKFKGLMSILPK